MTTGDGSGDKGKLVILSFPLFTLFLFNKIVCSKWSRIRIEIALPLPPKNRTTALRDEQITLMKVKNDPRSEFSNLSNWKEEA